ncbi:MAG TPA: hypothetical protein VGI40_20595 [Pirellulaceae bacterium]
MIENQQAQSPEGAKSSLAGPHQSPAQRRQRHVAANPELLVAQALSNQHRRSIPNRATRHTNKKSSLSTGSGPPATQSWVAG